MSYLWYGIIKLINKFKIKVWASYDMYKIVEDRDN